MPCRLISKEVFALTNLLKQFFALIVLTTALSQFSLAHAEVLVAADEQNFVAVYPVPLSPIEGETVYWTISFVQNFSLAKEPLTANFSVVEISSDKVLVSNNSVQVKGGVSSFSHEFEKPGIYELKISYAYLSEPSKILSIDYQMQVRGKRDFQPSAQQNENGTSVLSVALTFLAGLAFGLAAYHFVKKRS